MLMAVQQDINQAKRWVGKSKIRPTSTMMKWWGGLVVTSDTGKR